MKGNVHSLVIFFAVFFGASSWAPPRVYIVPGLVGTAPSYHLVQMAREAGYDPVVVRTPCQIAMARWAGDGPIIAHSSGNIAALWGGVVPDVDIGAVFDTGAPSRIHGSHDIFSRPRRGDYVIDGAGHLGVTSDPDAIEVLRRLLDRE